MKTDHIVMLAFMGAIIFVGVSLLVNTSKSCDVHIDYDVTVGQRLDGTNATLAEVQLACYKLCVEELKHQDYLMRDCLDKCENLP